eukprot:CAMPEP_0178704334 /NCGR_PEP_ID=MMETSP0699-20121125/14120_1 /TAXON_ID=265572 /ORGANISM="Extubocellulus spinifer, Strain CCMP396" /LENGTH=178 /DNA_ID=CAMNT_0020351665 /DNA_START=180 /DNA_END=717 /DNA_ORIENTATION=+
MPCDHTTLCFQSSNNQDASFLPSAPLINCNYIAIDLIACARKAYRLPTEIRDDDDSTGDIRKVSSATAASASVLVSTAALSPNPAFALKPNNEALCGTGFFTNIAQYKCTDIGDISDEGRSRQMSSEEESKLDSLMGKFDLSGPDLGSGGGGSGSTIDGEGTRSAEDKDAGKQREQGW